MALPLELHTLEAAANWYVRLNAGTPNDALLRSWQDWLGQNPANARAWARVEKVQAQMGRLPVEVALPTLAGVRARRRAVLKTLALLLAAGASGWIAQESAPAQALFAGVRTGKGERRRIELADGSLLQVNTDSALDIDYDDQQRLLRLHSGEISVQTASDPRGRPFIVQTREGRVRALGTRFCVRSDDGVSRVSVQQHAVEIRTHGQPQQSLRLDAGQSVRFDRQHIAPASAAAPGADAWTQGMLTVIEWRLADFVAELRRYRSGVVRCAETVADLRLSGAFRVDDTDTLLENLGASLPVKVRYLTRYWVSIEAA
ncbi:FecR domain-containing protein [Pseudomonas sp. 5P_5.1_Bac1]|uniref:FecR domain-containing protein n=1 Tax=Pseudomonas sp. 5P_5.1_Bac1 TaxID=2971616 RepID=UPI0021C7C57B|nr:FecR domain-containing protein [Pseudomonas sp. 5P_5.1_Bac1]MCU1720737.1 FecR domain-containing protein [Pseudomonas sp. 5P_5.1_Bac1]